MTQPLDLLIAIYITASGKGVSHAQLKCEETRQYGGQPDEAADGTDEPATADSRGAIFITGWQGFYHCHAWKEGVGDWYGQFHADDKHLTFVLNLTKEP